MKNTNLKIARELTGNLGTEAIGSAVNFMRAITGARPNARVGEILCAIGACGDPLYHDGVPFETYPAGSQPWLLDLAECDVFILGALKKCDAGDLRAAIAQFAHLIEGSVFDREAEADIRDQASKGLRFMTAAA